MLPCHASYFRRIIIITRCFSLAAVFFQLTVTLAIVTRFRFRYAVFSMLFSLCHAMPPRHFSLLFAAAAMLLFAAADA